MKLVCKCLFGKTPPENGFKQCENVWLIKKNVCSVFKISFFTLSFKCHLLVPKINTDNQLKSWTKCMLFTRTTYYYCLKIEIWSFINKSYWLNIYNYFPMTIFGCFLDFITCENRNITFMNVCTCKYRQSQKQSQSLICKCSSFKDILYSSTCIYMYL